MNKEHDRKQWDKMLKSLTDKDEQDKARRDAERKKRIEDRVKDTGL